MKKQSNKDYEQTINGFKAFNTTKNGKMFCRNFVYEEGKTYVCNGEIEPCKNGFHFCKSPLDVLNYYNIIDDNGNIRANFAKVKGSGEIIEDGDKYCCSKIKIETKIGFPDFITESIKSMLNTCPDNSKLASSGYNSQLASSGEYSQLASSGEYSQLASSGYDSQLASSGDYSQLASSGNNSKLASSGNDSKLASSGNNCVIAGIGYKNTAKGKVGSWIVLAEYDLANFHVKLVKAVRIDGKKIKEDTFYKLENGKFVETQK